MRENTLSKGKPSLGYLKTEKNQKPHRSRIKNHLAQKGKNLPRNL